MPISTYTRPCTLIYFTFELALNATSTEIMQHACTFGVKLCDSCHKSLVSYESIIACILVTAYCSYYKITSFGIRTYFMNLSCAIAALCNVT